MQKAFRYWFYFQQGENKRDLLSSNYYYKCQDNFADHRQNVFQFLLKGNM